MLVLTAYYLGSEIPQKAIVCQVCGWVIEFRHLGQNSASANIDGQFVFFPIFAIEMKLVVIPTLPDGRDRPPNHLLPSSFFVHDRMSRRGQVRLPPTSRPLPQGAVNKPLRRSAALYGADGYVRHIRIWSQLFRQRDGWRRFQRIPQSQYGRA